MISCYHLTVPLPDRTRPLLDDLSLEINQGDFAEIIGPSGAGKSVLFSLFSLRKKAAGGKSIICGRNLDRTDARGLAELRKKIGSCAQQPKFLEERSVVENLILPLVARDQSDGALQKVEALIDATRLAERADVAAKRLSQTERRLLALFRALVGKPSLVLVDGGLEGLGDLHDQGCEALASSHKRGATVVLMGREASAFDELRTLMFHLEDGRLDAVESDAARASHIDGAA